MPYVFEDKKKEDFTMKTGFYPVTITEIENPKPGTYGEQLFMEVEIGGTTIKVKKWIKTDMSWKLTNLVKAFKMDATVTEKEVDGETIETFAIEFDKQAGKTGLALVYMNAKSYVDIFEFIPIEAPEERKNSIMAAFTQYKDNGFRFGKKKTAAAPVTATPQPPKDNDVPF